MTPLERLKCFFDLESGLSEEDFRQIVKDWVRTSYPCGPVRKETELERIYRTEGHVF